MSINNELFITADNGIFKTDKYLNIFESYIRINAGYRNFYYNHTSDILHVASANLKSIELFYRNLSLISSISLTNSPYALTEKNGKLYVGLYGGVISVVENNLVVKNIPTFCTGWISSIVIDKNELMGVLCSTNNMLCLYTTNGSYAGKNMTTPSLPKFSNYDLNGNFIIAGSNKVNIYY